MNGVHDMGGQHCHGPVSFAGDTGLFHDDWERDVLAMALAMGATGIWNLDESRATRESLPPAYYLGAAYYSIWLAALEQLLVQHQLVSQEELEAGIAFTPPETVKRVLKADEVPTVLRAGSPVNRQTTTKPKFAIGEQVSVRQLHRRTHTRLPAYIRGHHGTVERIHGCHIFPDTHAVGQGEEPQWLYNISFKACDLWGSENENNNKVYVDCWEPYLLERHQTK